MNDPDDKVQIFHRINKLKMKAGVALDKSKHGYIDPKKVIDAQIKIDLKEEQIHDFLAELLDNLKLAWEKVQKEPENQQHYLEQMHNYANNILDLSETYDYMLMHSFGLSLRNFCEYIDTEKEEHKIIVKAHLDVMEITFKERLKEADTQKALELQTVLDLAIKKYSPSFA